MKQLVLFSCTVQKCHSVSFLMYIEYNVFLCIFKESMGLDVESRIHSMVVAKYLDIEILRIVSINPPRLSPPQLLWANRIEYHDATSSFFPAPLGFLIQMESVLFFKFCIVCRGWFRCNQFETCPLQ